MPRRSLLSGAAVVFLLSAFVLRPVSGQEGPAALVPAAPEIRGFWVDGFNPGIKTKQEVDTLIARLQRAGCNAVFAQVRKRGDAYYFSRYEPLALDNRNGWDPLGYLVQAAHAAKPRIAVHAWINTCAVGGPSFDAGHVLAKNPSWRSLSDTGADYDNEAVKIDPGVPPAAEWTYRVYLDVARSYAVDGIHFDFVRYGGAHWGYAPASVARFNARNRREGQPAWDDPLWQQWRRDQLSALVRKVYANVAAVRPHVVVSAAVIAWGDAPRPGSDWTQSSAYRSVFQDWRGWLQEGILDLACPMTYFGPQRRAYQDRWAEWIKEHSFERAATIGVGAWLNTVPQTLDLVRINQAPSRASGKKAAGTLFYSYKGTNATFDAQGKRGEDAYNESFYDALGQVFAPAVPFPAFPWKEAPTKGHLKGTLLAGNNLDGADGAQATLEGNGAKRTQVADGTGFFAFIDLAPGTYTLVATYQGETSAARTITVAPGTVATADLLLASGDLPAPRLVEGLGDEGAGARVLLQGRLVTAGTDTLGDHFFVADRIGGTPLKVRAPATLFMPLVRDDLVTLTGILQTEQNRKVLYADAVQVVGSRP